MTAPPDLKDFLSSFLVEAEEHVALANEELLALESAQRKGEHHPRAIRSIFRSLHTLKGLSAMVGIEPIVSIAHRMETFLREFERSGAMVPLGATDTLLKGVQAIAQTIATLSRGEEPAAPPPELVRELDALDWGPGAQGRRAEASLELEPALREKLTDFELVQLAKGVAAGQRALLAEFFPSPEKSAQGLSINAVRERVAKVAEIVRVLPRSVPTSPEAPGGLSFALILLTSTNDALVAEAVGVGPDRLQKLHGELTHEDPTTEAALDTALPLDEEPEAQTMGLRRGIVRVDVNRLDEAMEGLSALIVTRFRLARSVAALAARGVNTRELSDVVADNARQLRDLRAAIVRVRMVPVADVLDRIPLLVRGLQRATNRRVRIELEGGGAELDKSVSERLFPVIVHLVRNAVDHAIESPDERNRRGKPEEGLLRITCGARSNTRLELTVSDDGRGIDRKAVARKAGRPVPEDDAGLLDLLCIPGLSTRDVATTTSGRGMGMEIVKRIVTDELGGELALRTEFGIGTTFTLRVPLTISIVDAFAFECAGQRFVVPVATVDEIIEVDGTQLVKVPAAEDGSVEVEVLLRRGSAIPLVKLARLFRMRAGTPAQKAIVVRRGGAPIAFAVDRMLGQQEVVIRPMNDALIRAPGVSGATDLGDGRPTLVLDLVALSTTFSLPARAQELRP
ncbi:MAG TPA: chemotaxis protein CheW [Polyangiaceae bacterium]|nr:chemotaxis protein CheW [Polyangiaceae bacterium]